MIEPSFVKVAPYIQGTLDTNPVKRSFNSNGICFFEFYRLSNDLEPFYDQYYSRANTFVCNHKSSESNENQCGFCRELYHEGETWLQCSSSKVWFNEDCFGNSEIYLI